jgi:hypothetical protein
VTFAVLELCSQGGGPLSIRGFRLPGWLLPYHWLENLPAISQLVPGRFAIPAAGAAGAVLAFSLDAARSAAPQPGTWRRKIPVAVVVLAVLPLIPLPYRITAVPPVPAGWQAAFSRLRPAPDARVLIVPVTLIGPTAVMRWQADTGEPGSQIGGYFLSPSPTGQAAFGIGPTTDAAEYLNRLWAGRAPLRRIPLVRSALAVWRPAAVVAVTRTTSALGQFLISLLGPPAFHVRRLLVWRL